MVRMVRAGVTAELPPGPPFRNGPESDIALLTFQNIEAAIEAASDVCPRLMLAGDACRAAPHRPPMDACNADWC